MRILVNAQSAFDQYTRTNDSATWASINADYDGMIVYSPYFDSRLVNYDNESLVYTNMYGLQVNVAGDTRAADNPDWILRTPSGGSVYIPWGCGGASGCPQYAADVGNPGFRNDFVARIGNLLARGYSGVMIDDVNMVRRFGDVNGNVVYPINPRTGTTMLISEWRADMVSLLERVRTTYPTAKIMHNTIWYADTPTLDNVNIDRQITAADYIMLERGANDQGLTGGTGNYSYSRFLAFIDRVHRLGGNVLLLDQFATTSREQRFNLVTGLLINDGNDFVGTEDFDLLVPGSMWSGFDVDLGNARGARFEQNGVYRRDFDDGIVLLSGPANTTQTVQLGGPFLTEGGQTVTEVTLGARDSIILRRP